MLNGLRRTTKYAWSATAFLFFVMAFTGTAHSQQTDAANLPTAAQVLQHYVDATGGRDALMRHKSMTVHGRFQAPAQKLDVETVSYSRGLKSLQRALLPGGKEYVSGYDGEVAWDMDPTQRSSRNSSP